MGGHYMKGKFLSFEQLLNDLRDAKDYWELEMNLHFEQAEIKYDRFTGEYELSVYFGK